MKPDESKIADRLSKIVSDVTLDVEQVGLYVGRMPNVILHRLEIITEVAREEKDNLHLPIDNNWRQVYNRTMNETTFINKCNILSELWLNFRDEANFEDFVNYNDLGLPLAYAISAGIVSETNEAKKFVEEAFDILLATMQIEEDTGYETLDEIFVDGMDLDEEQLLGSPAKGSLGYHTFHQMSTPINNKNKTLRQL